MKKLMIAVAIVCAAAMSQAANFSWGLDNYEQFGPDDSYNTFFDAYLNGASAVLYIGDTAITEPAFADPDMGTYGVDDNSAVDTTGKVRALASGDIGETFEGQAFKIVLTTGDGKYQAVIEDVSGFVGVSQGVDQPNLNYETFVSAKTVSAGDWVAVPEPTSGLLLLLGVAGLALRRRRA